MNRSESDSGFLRLSLALGLAAAGCLLLFVLRVAISGTTFYSYLVWNLLLAIMPYAVAALGMGFLSRRPRADIRLRALVAWATAFLWLAFYPNAPYIFTDFIHVVNKTFLRARPAEWLGMNAFIWYDLLMTAAFAFIGHFIGLVSMWIVREGYSDLWGEGAARALVAAAILLSGFGIYLGRFSRLNTWDIVSNPWRVLGEAAEAAADFKPMLFSAAFSLFIFFTYAALSAFKRVDMPRTRGRKD
jgi:uncharacterized membrane protein